MEKKTDFWDAFMKSGKIADYLNYKGIDYGKDNRNGGAGYKDERL